MSKRKLFEVMKTLDLKATAGDAPDHVFMGIWDDALRLPTCEGYWNLDPEERHYFLRAGISGLDKDEVKRAWALLSYLEAGAAVDQRIALRV